MIVKPKPAAYCRLCGGTGKVDRGNGSTKPCTCIAGLIAGLIERNSRRKPRKVKP